MWYQPLIHFPVYSCPTIPPFRISSGLFAFSQALWYHHKEWEVTAVELDIGEALRYLGAGDQPPEALRREIAAVADELARVVRPRFVYRVFPVSHAPEGETLAGSGVTLPGETARRMLESCDQAALLLCTLGAEFETLLRAWQARDMARAVLLDACGSAWVEAGCDEAERELAARFPDRHLTDRFSPGYGDLPLSLQPPLCAALDGRRRLGIQVTESFLMIPTKTVSAVIGLSDRPQAARIRGCAFCSMAADCALRKGGKTCAP